MKKYVSNLIVTENICLHSNYFLLKLTQKEKLPAMEAGQFVQVQVQDSVTTFLRRPISVHFIDRERNELWLLIQIVGGGTRKLSELKSGDALNIIYPLGNHFSLPEKKTDKDKQNILLVGGGVGLAPMLFLGNELHNLSYRPIFLIGAKSKNGLLQLSEFEKYGEVYTATEDGSFGETGLVIEHSILSKEKFDRIYACGPNPMMRAIASYAKKNNTTCEVSLENSMACGIGACLCCVENTTEGNVCVCTEGPVFNINKLQWQI